MPTANKSVRFMWGALLVLGLAIALNLLTEPRRTSDPALATASLEAFDTLDDSTGAIPLQDPRLLCCVEEFSLRSGQSLDVLFEECKLQPGESTALVTALKEVINVRTLRPEDRFRFFRLESGELSRLEYQRSPEQKVVVEAGETAFVARWESEPVDIFVHKISGTIESSLYMAVVEAGGGPALVLDFADLFSWDFDFLTDTRQGDTFEMLVEERSVNGSRIGFGRVLAGFFTPVDRSEPMTAYSFQWGEGDDLEEGYYTGEGKSVKKFFLKSPLNYRRISSGFTHHRMHPIHKTVRPHLGVDYAAPKGTHVVALGAGRVEWVGTKGGYGKTVIIKHNATYKTQYAHLSKYGPGMKVGVRVAQGQLIGHVGSTGVSTGPHLDFRVQENGKWINPLTLKGGGGSEPLPEGQRAAFSAWTRELDVLRARMRPGESLLSDPGHGPLPLAAVRLDTPSPS